MTTVTAPSRLHFGLLNLPREGVTHWPGVDGQPGLPVRQFGGVGLMIDRPGVRVTVELSDEWSGTGPLSHRALDFAKTFTQTLGIEEGIAFRVQVLDCPDEHTGLGVGTSLALSVAKGIAVEMGHPDWDSVELAKRVGRGERSAVGIHGFHHGGFIVEAGKLPGEAISPLIGRYDFPEEWGLLLLHPVTSDHWSGSIERDAFRRLANGGDLEAEVLYRILMTATLPALIDRDFRLFSESIYEYNHRVGRRFSSVQAGCYSHPEVTRIIDHLRGWGILGVGQSSWGPTVFCLVEDPNRVDWLNEKLELIGSRSAIEHTKSNSVGALVSRNTPYLPKPN